MDTTTAGSGFTADERLAFLEALNKTLNDKKEGLLTEAKAEARSELLGLFDSHGVDRRALIVGGRKVGEVGISFSQPKAAIKGERRAEALEFLLENGLAEITPVRGWEGHFAKVGTDVMFADTGELVDWALWDEGGAKAAAVRGCKPQEVMEAFGPRLQGQTVTNLLLGEG